MGTYWHNLAGRERRVLLLGGAVALLFLGWLLLWRPLAQARATLRTQVAQGAVELQWMQRALPALQARTPDAAAALPHDGRSLLARVDAGAREAGLGSSLLRVEPVGQGEVRIAFASADFDALVAWLEQFSAGERVSVTELSVQRVAGVGLVDARLALREGAGR